MADCQALRPDLRLADLIQRREPFQKMSIAEREFLAVCSRDLRLRPIFRIDQFSEESELLFWPLYCSSFR